MRLNPKGVPIPFTIKVSGFLPEAEIFVEQCDGTSPENQKWSPTVDCDYGTQAAPLRADANGDRDVSRERSELRIQAATRRES